MVRYDVLPWERLETRSATAFLVVGGIWFVDTVLLVLERAGGMPIPDPVFPVLILSALTVSVVGLFGFYPRLANRSRWLARLGIVVTALAGVGFAVLLAWWVVANAIRAVPIPPAPLLMVTVFAVLFGFAFFGVASVWTGVPSRSVGFLLLAVVATLVGYLVSQAVYGSDPPAWVAPTLTAVLTVITLAIGYRLRTEPSPTDRAGPASDPTA